MMTRHRSALTVFTLALALCSPAASAQEAPAPKNADEAKELYENALQSIAEGRKKDASATLARVIEKEPRHAGAYLEVALIQCSLGRSNEAERLFAIIETRFDPSPLILDLINEARQTGCDNWQASSTATVTLARGIDQNVNQGASNPNYIIDRDGGQIALPLLPDFLPKHDQYTAIGVDYMREVTPNGTIGIAQFQGRRNDTLSQYDSSGIYLGLETPYRFGAWTLRTTGTLGLVALGGSFYQRQLQLQARIGPPLPLPNSVQFNLTGGVTHTQYMTLTNFDSNTFELRGQFTYHKNSLYSSASFSYQDDRARAQRPGGDRQGFVANLLVRRKLGSAYIGELGYSRQGWGSSEAYAPGLIDQVRKQTTHALRATLSYPISKQQSVQLEARVVRNRENISLFQYNNRQLHVSWQWQTP